MGRAEAETAIALYGTQILHLAYSYLHNQADAEDVLQDAMVQLICRAPDFESPEHTRAWLLRVAINLCKNRLRAPWKRWAPLPEDYPGQGIPEESLDLFQAVGALPVRYREVVHLFYYEDLTTAEIAALLGEREEAVRKRLSRARAQLRDVLKERGEPDGTL